MAPLADFAHVQRDLVVTAYQSASGVVNLITPTSAVVMGGLAIARVPWVRYLRWVAPLLLILTMLNMIVLEYRRDDLTRQAAYQSGLQIWCSDK